MVDELHDWMYNLEQQPQDDDHIPEEKRLAIEAAKAKYAFLSDPILLEAAFRGDYGTCKMLVEDAGIDVRLTNENAYNALHICAKYTNSREIADVLLSSKYSAEILDAAGYEGNTPLIYAALYGNYNVMEVLLHRGANILLKNEANVDALQCAMDKGHSRCEQLLRKAKIRLETGK